MSDHAETALAQLRGAMGGQGCLCLYSRCPVHGEGTGTYAVAYSAIEALVAERDGLRARVEQRGLGPAPVEGVGGPGKEEAYWLRQKLDASVRHLRDIEDYYRMRGGLPEGFNQIRADRARSLYEQISEDFLNGKTTIPTMRERAEAAEARVEQLEAALREPEKIARLFHEAYERLAPSFGYETRTDSAVPWDDVPEPNRSLMIAVAAEVAAALSGLGDAGDTH